MSHTKDEGPGSETTRAAWTRLVVTLAAPLFVFVGARLSLPGVDEAALAGEARWRSAAMAPFDPFGPPVFGLFGLGVAPLVYASLLTSLAALAVPRWAVLRHAGPEGRAKLWRATLAVALGIAALQAGHVVVRMARSPWAVLDRGYGSDITAFLGLVAGSMLLLYLAELVSRRGLANGIVVVIASLWASDWAMVLAGGAPRGALSTTPADLLADLPGAALAVVATWAALRPSAPAPTAEREGGYRMAGARTADLTLPGPACGIAPLVAAGALLALVEFSARASGSLSWMSRGLARPYIDAPLRALIAAFACVLLVRLFSGPRPVAELWSRLAAAPRTATEDAARRAFGPAIARSIAYVMALLVASELPNLLGGSRMCPVPVALATALALDVASELRARRRTSTLVAVWTEPRPHAAAAALRLLEAEDIPAFARDERQRRLLQILGPFVPIVLFVRADGAERAGRLVRAALSGSASREETGPVRPPLAVSAAPARSARLWALAGVLLAAYACLAIAPALGEAPQDKVAVSLEVVSVDDEADPFRMLAGSKRAVDLPQGVTFAVENVPLGRGRTEPRDFATLRSSDGESLDATLARARLFFDRVRLPKGRRLAFGRIWGEDLEEPGGAGATVGRLRTYLLHGEPVVTGLDVADARVVEDMLGGYQVAIELRPEGAERFRRLTAENVKRRVAIVVDGLVEMAPVVQSEISGGNISLTLGPGEPREQLVKARRLADALRP